MNIVEGWIPCGEAARMRGVTNSAMLHLARTGKLQSRKFDDRPSATTYFLFSEARQGARASARARKRVGLPRWKESGPETEWISTEQAAEILGVSKWSVRHLARTGRLSARKQSERKNARLLLAQDQVFALQDCPEWRQSRDAAVRGWERLHAAAPQADAEKRATAPEWLTPAQVALYLGVSRASVYQYRRLGRLRACRLPKGGGKYQPQWVFRREDVEALEADAEFAAKRARYRRAFSEAAQAQRKEARLVEQLEGLARIKGWDRPDYTPTYQGWPGGVW